MRRGITLVAMLGTSLALAACSGSTETPADETTSAAADGGTLTIWVDESRQAAVEAAAVAFEEATGGGGQAWRLA